MANCITCGIELHPERAKKYNYCMARECQQKNAQGLTMVAIGMNKAAEELMILDERTQAELADGKYRDQRRGTFGPPVRATAGPPAPTGTVPTSTPRTGTARTGPGGRRQPRHPAPGSARTPAANPWTNSQQKLALLYNEQGLRPDEIAAKLGISARLVTQIILAARNRGKL
jgi:hypothetical protein